MENELQTHFGRYIDEAEHSSGLSKVTIAGYKAVFDFFLEIMPEVTVLESLTEEMLNEFFKRIHTRRRIVGRNTPKIGVKDTTIKTYWAKLHTFFAWLKNRELIRNNPLQNIRPPSVSYEDFRRLTDKQIKEIYAAIALHSINPLIQRRDTFMVSLLLYCGLRLGEFISLQVTDIDLEKKEITIRAETSKSKRSRTLRLHLTLLLHLKDYIKERNLHHLTTASLLVSNRGDRGLSRHGLKHWVKNLIIKSGVKFHLHMFRHTFACKLAEADVNLARLSMIMGHKDIDMTLRYTRSLRTEDMGDAINKIVI